MGVTYKKAGLEDLALLTESRVEVLRAANGLPEDADMETVREQSERYYQKALRDGGHTAYLVLDGSRLAGTGGVSFFR